MNKCKNQRGYRISSWVPYLTTKILGDNLFVCSNHTRNFVGNGDPHSVACVLRLTTTEHVFAFWPQELILCIVVFISNRIGKLLMHFASEERDER
jgi:hypothetical protein